MHRIQRYDSITLLKDNVYYHQIMDMIEVVADAIASDVWLNTANDEIAGCTTMDLSSNMTRENELSIVPLNFGL